MPTVIVLSTCTAIACGCLIFGEISDERHDRYEKEHGPRGGHGENVGGPARMGSEPGLLLRMRCEAGGRQGPERSTPVLPGARWAAPQVPAAGASRRGLQAGHSGGGAGESGAHQVRSERPRNPERLRQPRPAGQPAAQIGGLNGVSAGGDEPGTVTRQEKLPNEVSYCLRFRRTANRVPAHAAESGRSMTLRWAFFLWFIASTAFRQTPLPGSSSNDQSPAAQTQPNADEQNKHQDGAQSSTPDVKPGPPVLKQKDLWKGTGVLHPLLRMPKYILQDQKECTLACAGVD